jgi:hypothetical protein
MAMNKFDLVPDGLNNAFRQTDYSFTDGGSTIVMRLDGANLELLSYLGKKQISSWAYITAWNPTSLPQADACNQSQQQHLLEHLKVYEIFKGEGKGRDGNWPPEESYFVAGISREDAITLGKEFRQTAILVSGKNLEPELVLTCID